MEPTCFEGSELKSAKQSSHIMTSFTLWCHNRFLSLIRFSITVFKRETCYLGSPLVWREFTGLISAALQIPQLLMEHVRFPAAASCSPLPVPCNYTGSHWFGLGGALQEVISGINNSSLSITCINPCIQLAQKRA